MLPAVTYAAVRGVFGAGGERATGTAIRLVRVRLKRGKCCTPWQVLPQLPVSVRNEVQYAQEWRKNLRCRTENAGRPRVAQSVLWSTVVARVAKYKRAVRERHPQPAVEEAVI